MDENRNIHSPVKHAFNVQAAQVFTPSFLENKTDGYIVCVNASKA
jgi:hypothetical protein